MENVRMIFDNSAKEQVLDLLNKKVDEEGKIVEKDNPTQKVVDSTGSEVSFEEFGGVKRGSEVFIKNDLISLMKLSKE